MIATIVRTFIIYCFVSLCVRIMGKRQLGQLQPGELVITILISEIAATPITDTNQPILNTAISLMLLVSFEIISSLIARKSLKFRYASDGKPITIIKNGKLNQQNLKTLRFTIDEVLSALRQKDVFDINDVEYAVVETNGTLSVLLKQSKQPLSQETYQSPKKTTDAPCVVIIDGKIIESSLEDSPVTLDEINRRLEKDKTSTKNILLMTVTKSKRFMTISKER
ncbi:MAG: DUF421 domain-containing protein [Clostridia bacterium]|nr:DUF421 domain-containing protein [Clostridia bacterium]